MRRFLLSLALAGVLIIGLAPSAAANDLVDSDLVDRVECLFRVYVNEGGESGLDCLS